MALFRQWWVPVGLGSTEGGYVHYPLDDLMSVLALESERPAASSSAKTSAPCPTKCAARWPSTPSTTTRCCCSKRRRDGSFRRPEQYVRRAIATVTTHDLPTLRGYWEGRDLALRDRLQLFPGEEIRRQVFDERVRDRAQLLAALEAAGLRPDAARGCRRRRSARNSPARSSLYLARSAAALAVLQIEDLIGMGDPVNVPGTSDEHANWQRKITATIEDVFEDEPTAQFLEDVQFARSS